jgi:two-component system chemotaxis sensor kinase CheA
MSQKPAEHQALAARQERRRLTITQKLVALIVLTTGVVVAALAIYFPDQQIRASRAALERKAAMYARLVSRQVASAVAFDDRETAREVFESVAQDADVLSLTLFTQSGAVLHQHGKAGDWIVAAKDGVQEQRVVELGDRLGVAAPVTSLEGPRGTLVLELSMLPLAEAKARIARTAVLVGAAALALGALLAYFVARSLGRRIGAIATVASAVTAGDLEQAPVTVEGRDEVALLAEAFNSMLARMRGLLQQIRSAALEEQERLERLVQERTRELDARNASLTLILDNVGQGFLKADLKGRIAQERSAIVDQWFGEPAPNEHVWDYLGRTFVGEALRVQICWEALSEEWMPLDLRIDQMPWELKHGERYFGFEYKPIFDGETLASVLIVISDNTLSVQQRLAKENEQELIQSVRWLLADRSGFEDFLAEAGDLVAAIQDDGGDRVTRMRLIHTLKGNSAIFGLGSMARTCHDIETRMADSDDDLPAPERQRLQTVWERLRERIEPFVRGRSSEQLHVTRADYEQVLGGVAGRARHSHITQLLRSWELEPTEGRLRRLAEYAQGLAERLGKSPICVQVESNDVRLDSDEWSAFWRTLVHVVRNAIDHGLLSAEERAQAGEAGEGKLVLRSEMRAGLLRIEVQDNGRGVDWKRVAEAARRKGLPADTREDLEHALFADSVTTNDEVTLTSGRGVGLSAVRQICDATGGRVRVESTGGGTRFVFEWAVDEIGRRRAGSSSELVVAEPEKESARAQSILRGS